MSKNDEPVFYFTQENRNPVPILPRTHQTTFISQYDSTIMVKRWDFAN